MKLQELMIGILIIGGLVTGLYAFMGDVSDGYNVDFNDTQYASIYDDTETLASDLNENYNNLTTGETSTTTQFFTGAILVWRIIKSMLTLPVTIFVTIVNTLALNLGLPAWVLGTLLSVVTVWIIFSLLGWLRGWKE